MEKQEWQEPQVSEIDIADETQLEPASGTDTVDPVAGDPLGS